MVDSTAQNPDSPIAPNFAEIAAKVRSRLAGTITPVTISLGGVERCKTGVPGFDELVGGGFVKDSVMLVGGDTGTGKTTFCLQFLYNGVKDYSENGMLISFSESRESLFRSAAIFGWDFAELEGRDRLVFLRYQPKDVLEIVREGGGTIRDTIEAFKVRRVVIDSLTAYSMMFESAYKEQQYLLELFELLHTLKCTTLVVSEEPVRVEGYRTDRAEFLSDGIIHFYNIHKKGARVRAVEVIKMRDSAINEKVCPMRIDAGGIVVYPNQPVFEA